MSRPRKGVGEHRLLKKGPLLVTTALLTFYPVCVAEAATSSFEKQSASSLSGAYTHLQNHQSQTMLLDRLRNQPRSYQDPRSLSSVPLSIETLDTLKSTLSKYQTQLNTLKNSQAKDPKNAKDYALAITNVENLISDLKTRISKAESDLNSLKNAQNALQNALSTLQASQIALSDATTQKLQAIEASTTAKSNLDVAQSNLEASTTLKEQADAALTQQNATTSQSLAILNEHKALKASALSNLEAKQDALHDAQQAQQQAQSNYNTNLIPDPTWTPLTHEVAYTRLVPVTTTVTTGGVTAKSYNRQGYNNAPPLPTSNEQPIATTTVPNISFQWGGGQVLNSGRSEDVIVEFTGVITVPTTGNYKFYAPGDDGVQFFINGNRIINDWYDKGGGGSVSQDVYLEAGKSNTFTLYFYENGGGANVWLYYYTPATGYQIVPAAWLGQKIVTETTYVEETYYVTEVIPGQTHPLINDPLLLPPLEEANANLTEAENQARAAEETLNEATLEVTAAEENYNTQVLKSQEAQTSYEQASLKVEENKTILLNSTSAYNSSLTDVDAKTSAESAAQINYDQATLTKEEIETSLAILETSNEASFNLAQDSSSKIPPAFEAAIQLQTKEPKPEPEPEPEPEPTGSPDIPTDLSADNLMDVDLEKVDPTELTPEQAEQLKEAALETFETAEEGSPEYQQALDALALAAQEDDIVLDESIAAIPGVGQAAAAVVAVFNIVGNVGADISPKVRKKAQEVVVTTLVVGQIAQNAATAAAAAAGFRRRN